MNEVVKLPKKSAKNEGAHGKAASVSVFPGVNGQQMRDAWDYFARTGKKFKDADKADE
jgi:hypothetical protein